MITWEQSRVGVNLSLQYLALGDRDVANNLRATEVAYQPLIRIESPEATDREEGPPPVMIDLTYESEVEEASRRDRREDIPALEESIDSTLVGSQSITTTNVHQVSRQRCVCSLGRIRQRVPYWVATDGDRERTQVSRRHHHPNSTTCLRIARERLRSPSGTDEDIGDIVGRGSSDSPCAGRLDPASGSTSDVRLG